MTETTYKLWHKYEETINILDAAFRGADSRFAVVVAPIRLETVKYTFKESSRGRCGGTVCLFHLAFGHPFDVSLQGIFS